MKKIFCVICGKYREFEKPKISYHFEKTLVFSMICIYDAWRKRESKI